MTTEFLVDGPIDASVTLLLAHGAGAGMDHSFMNAAAEALAEEDIKVVRFEFPYMVRRRVEGRKFPPNRAPALLEAYESAIAEAPVSGKLVVAGKSMGGRMASLLAVEKADALGIEGLVCLGFPFYAPGKERIPDNNRGEHLASMSVPTLIVQGERDTFGTADDLGAMNFAAPVAVCILPDGDHSLVPRKKSGITAEQNMAAMATAVRDFLESTVCRSQGQ